MTLRFFHMGLVRVSYLLPVDKKMIVKNLVVNLILIIGDGHSVRDFSTPRVRMGKI